MVKFALFATCMVSFFSVASATEPSPLRIVFLGDSLTAGYQLNPADAFPAIIGEELRKAGKAAEVINAGVSGDTTAGGLRRMQWLLRREIDVLVLGLGANDALRGLSPDAAKQNLHSTIAMLRSRYPEARVVLLGMLAPPNMGEEYRTAFNAIYPDLADEFNLVLMPFMLDQVAAIPELNLPDGIHPNERGHAIIARNLMPYLNRVFSQSDE